MLLFKGSNEVVSKIPDALVHKNKVYNEKPSILIIKFYIHHLNEAKRIAHIQRQFIKISLTLLFSTLRRMRLGHKDFSQ
ncbi:hypothetical protein ABE61_14470 [Lysinibacillus sphaericus]|nr:hypothetical protein [Lysinibacillus sphaericus]MBG9478769.1 hypothetical protein [Lysinibacillus sphaericus]MBG9592497.1 hypothetical protein [Lysinibacillus sphaericus]